MYKYIKSPYEINSADRWTQGICYEICLKKDMPELYEMVKEIKWGDLIPGLPEAFKNYRVFEGYRSRNWQGEI